MFHHWCCLAVVVPNRQVRFYASFECVRTKGVGATPTYIQMGHLAVAMLDAGRVTLHPQARAQVAYSELLERHLDMRDVRLGWGGTARDGPRVLLAESCWA